MNYGKCHMNIILCNMMIVVLTMIWIIIYLFRYILSIIIIEDLKSNDELLVGEAIIINNYNRCSQCTSISYSNLSLKYVNY